MSKDTMLNKLLETEGVKVYIVGGYVRDRLLGLDPKDHDFVVVGCDIERMEWLGFQLVGMGFPVYLSATGDEFALARTEKKTGSGYHGFSTAFGKDVTLEEDLFRRDLTINAMAREVLSFNEEGHAKLSDEIIDPYNGQNDLEEGRIRHVSDAFGDDPVRVLRAARFACRYGFGIMPDTFDMMKWMVRDGELDHLTAERVWLEASKAMMEKDPMDFFSILDICGALEKVVGLDNFDVGLSFVRKQVTILAEAGGSLEQRFAAFTSQLAFESCEAFYRELKAPSDVTRLALRVNKMSEHIENDVLMDGVVSAEWTVQMLEQMTAYRSDSDMVMDVRVSLAPFGGHFERVMAVLDGIHTSTKDVRFDSLPTSVQRVAQGKEIGEAIHVKRVELAQRFLTRMSANAG